MSPTCTKCSEPWADNDHVCNALLVAKLTGDSMTAIAADLRALKASA